MRYGSKLRILIAGGGIAGLTLAAALEQRGMTADVIERAQGYGGVGYVLGLWPSGLNVLYSLGMREALLDISLPCGAYSAIDRRDRQMLSADFSDMVRGYGDMFYMERAGLIDVLLRSVQRPVTFGKTITAIAERGDCAVVTFSDDTQAEYDAVVGADGLRSSVRQLAFGDVPLTYHGITGWAFWTDVQIGNDTKEFYANGRFMGFYPSKERTCCFAAMAARRDTADDSETRRQRLEGVFADFPEFARGALQSSTDASIWHDDFLDVRVKRWTGGRVALLGDAAHAVLPTAGVGASLAIESAYVLADELSRSGSESISAALSRYEARRRRRADGVQRQSRQMAWMIRTSVPGSAVLRDAVFRVIPGSAFSGMFKPLMASAI